ncbi:uncharacterized protein LOC121401615 isoform X2 [Xenopus laevis]|uniref:Uncharacterized protein LOC121401615 isoform X2 n=1 Tax=Xenopus laevis TaxID=8355 RepID=A0A8J1MMV4_XENLA|nr:uncharacterized protein LOC121401615 isoform X2 [Xenopus laevis]
MWHGGGRTTLRRNQSTGQKDIPIHWHKMDRGNRQRHLDDQYNMYENMQVNNPTITKIEIYEEAKENLSAKFLKASEMLRTQRRLLMVLVALLILVFIFLIIVTSLVFTYYSLVSTQLKQADDEKSILVAQIESMNRTLDDEKSILLAQIESMNRTLGEQKNDLTFEIKEVKKCIGEQKNDLTFEIKEVKKCIGILRRESRYTFWDLEYRNCLSAS